MSPKSTFEVAKVIGVTRSTLERWLALGKINPPKPLRVGRNVFRLWTIADVQRVRKYKEKNYWKGRGPKPKPKQ